MNFPVGSTFNSLPDSVAVTQRFPSASAAIPLGSDLGSGNSNRRTLPVEGSSRATPLFRGAVYQITLSWPIASPDGTEPLGMEWWKTARLAGSSFSIRSVTIPATQTLPFENRIAPTWGHPSGTGQGYSGMEYVLNSRPWGLY